MSETFNAWAFAQAIVIGLLTACFAYFLIYVVVFGLSGSPPSCVYGIEIYNKAADVSRCASISDIIPVDFQPYAAQALLIGASIAGYKLGENWYKKSRQKTKRWSG